MSKYVKQSGLQIQLDLYNFLENKVLPHVSIFENKKDFWDGLANIFSKFTPKNKQILEKRNILQKKIDEWEENNFSKERNIQDYKNFLYQIGYLVKESEDFSIDTNNIDDEISIKAGPQLVVPAMNARYALNAANARWGSLYDAIYGTDVIDTHGDLSPGTSYNEIRGQAVIKFAKQFLDENIPLINASHKNVIAYKIENQNLVAILQNNHKTNLINNELFVAFNGEKENPSEILFLHHGLHINIVIDKQSKIGKQDSAGIKDIILESALTSIIDLEDSMVAVDGEDKAKVYENILGFMKGDICIEFEKNGKLLNRKLNQNLKFNNIKNDSIYNLSGKSLLFFRSVGFLMTTSAILNEQGEELPENILDDVIIALTSHFDLNNSIENRNSKKGSVYIVKPKMHGPEEVALANEIFSDIEKFVCLPKNTLKIGVMDEERRTSVNLKSCIKEVKSRIAFINTGFLDRTGDEIHTSSKAGVMVRKQDMKKQKWLNSYELNNVQIGLSCGLSGKAQIGKGMWAMTDLMAKMLKEKISQLEAGASTTWVPSPTAATIHALHYHKINIFEVQKKLLKNQQKNYLDDLLQISIIQNPNLSKEEIQQELYNNCQGILGYVVRWVEHGIGCSKVPDIQNVALMEDRATLRISSQGLANWLLHKIINHNDIEEALQKIAYIVDKQNVADVAYIPMGGRFTTSKAYLAAKDLIFKGLQQPSGYTEPLLYKWRKLEKLELNVK